MPGCWKIVKVTFISAIKRSSVTVILENITDRLPSLDANDFPAILAHAETEAAVKGTEFSVEVPMVNRAAVDYLLSRGCKLESFFEFFMADSVFGKFENYILTSPPFFV